MPLELGIRGQTGTIQGESRFTVDDDAVTLCALVPGLRLMPFGFRRMIAGSWWFGGLLALMSGLPCSPLRRLFSSRKRWFSACNSRTVACRSSTKLNSKPIARRAPARSWMPSRSIWVSVCSGVGLVGRPVTGGTVVSVIATAYHTRHNLSMITVLDTVWMTRKRSPELLRGYHFTIPSSKRLNPTPSSIHLQQASHGDWRRCWTVEAFYMPLHCGCNQGPTYQYIAWPLLMVS